MTESKKYIIDLEKKIPFHNNVDFCIGTGRMGLALQKEYQEQLKMVQEEIGFQYIRGHGLFSDDLAVYQQYRDKNGELHSEYNFTYLDLVMDNFLSLGIRPFLELGFMPEKMASGEQTVFYWKGNVTPPADYEEWCKLVQNVLRHLVERYGREEVTGWPIEVWNEPNLPGFWKDKDMQEYFKLFEKTFYAVKEIDADFRVGGPAICGVEDEYWMKEFIQFCHQKKIPLDFVTRHHYTSEIPEYTGHYGYVELSDADRGFDILHTTRKIVDSFEEFRGKEIHITEFNTSYIPQCPLHDTNQNAAYIAYLLSRLGEDNESYSYWTFGDIFEECGVPFTPFYGGFGLVANGRIKKPTFWTFVFFKKLKGECILKERNVLAVQKKDKTIAGILFNDCKNRTDITKKISLSIPAVEEEYCLVTKTVDEDTCNPLKCWHDLGEPSSLSREQRQLILDHSTPFQTTEIIKKENNIVNLSFIIRENGMVYFELIPRRLHSDRGYDYNRVMQISE